MAQQLRVVQKEVRRTRSAEILDGVVVGAVLDEVGPGLTVTPFVEEGAIFALEAL